MKCELISIGDELLIGQTVNTNASWLGDNLNQIGVNVIHCAVISDDKEAILTALGQALKRSDLVLITGGLGPTIDDITKQTLAEYFSAKLIRNEHIENKIISYFSDRGLPILQTNLDQALLPDSCRILHNSRGTASGMWFEKDKVVFISLPGVPYEMKGIMNETVFPEIIKMNGIKNVMVNKTVRTHGMGESFLSEVIKDWENDLNQSKIKLAYLPSPGIVKLRLTASGDSEGNLTAKIQKHINQLNQIIPNEIYGYDSDKMEDVVGALLFQNDFSVSTAESCTGGTVAKMITSKSGSSNYFNGSIVCYSNTSKEELLVVNKNHLETFGAVSQQVVEQMAIGVKAKFHSDFGLATSGIAGPTGGTSEKPVGTIWIAVSGPKGVISKKLNLGYSRERNIHVTSLSVLNLLRLELIQ
jgi:nicotinamide-nucleotide amidase